MQGQQFAIVRKVGENVAGAGFHQSRWPTVNPLFVDVPVILVCLCLVDDLPAITGPALMVKVLESGRG